MKPAVRSIKPAVRIIFAPIALRERKARDPLREAPLRGDANGRTIRIDPRLPNVAKTLLHELIHIRHPGWPEERVEAAEEIRWQRMGWREKARLYQMLATARLEGENA